MAINFLDAITVNSGTGSASTIVATGARPVTIKGGGIGSVAIGGSNGGWATGYLFTGYSGTNRGGFGALGNVDTVSYYYIGDAYNDTTMVVQPNAGNVGIGTTSPAKKLHVKESTTTTYAAYIENTIAGGDYLAMVGDAGNNVFEFDSSGTGGEALMKMYKDGVLKTQIDVDGTSYFNGGNVGIGTTSPQAKLEVNDSSNDIQMRVGSLTAGISPQIRLQGKNTANTTNYYADIELDAENGKLIFNDPGTSGGSIGQSPMVLDSSGNVGIGTTGPAYKLSVENSLQVFSSGDTANPKIEGHLLRVTDTANDNPDVEHRFVENHSLNYGFSWFMDGGNNNFSLRRHDNSANGTTVFRVNRSNDIAYFAGNVGIGTTAPVGKLEVAGNFRLKGTGSGNNSYPIHFTNTAVAIGRNDNNLELHGYNAIVLGVSSTGYPTSTERMRITNSGNIGIGTTAPSQKLDVNGNIVFSQRLVANSNQYYVKLGVWSYASTYGIGMTNAFTYGALNNDYAMTFCMNNDSDRGFWWGYDGQSKSTGAMSLNMQGKLKINHSIGLGTANPSATQGRIDASNDIVAYSSSDIRLKDNIKSIDKALDKVNKIQGIEFDWIEKEEVHGNSGHDVGVIAQEIEKVLPEVVDTRDNGYKAVKYEKLVPLLIEAIKDLSKQVDGLKRLI